MEQNLAPGMILVVSNPPQAIGILALLWGHKFWASVATMVGLSITTAFWGPGINNIGGRCHYGFLSFLTSEAWNMLMTWSSQIHFFFFNNPLTLINLFINLFLAVLGLRFCVRASSSCGKRGLLFIAVRGPLTVTASLVAEHRLQTRRLSSCGSRA